MSSGRMSAFEGRGSGQRGRFYITHVEPAGPFLKLFVQRDDMKRRMLKDSLGNLSTKLDNGLGALPLGSHFKKDNKVLVQCGLADTSSWYRGTIVGIVKVNTYYVYLSDVGRVEVVDAQHIRCVKQAAECGERFIETCPPLSTELHVAGLAALSNKWEPFEIQHARNVLVGIVAVHVTDFITTSGVEFAVLNIEDDTIANFLIEHGLIANKLSREEHNRYTADALSPNTTITAISPPIHLLEELPESSSHLVSISSIEDGPRKFYIRLEDEDIYWQRIKSALKKCSAENPPPLRNFEVNMSCLVKKNESLFRAQLLGFDGHCQLQVQYLDFGNKDAINFADVYAVPEQLKALSVHPLALAFSLYGCERLQPSLDELFRKLTLGKQLQMKVMPEKKCRLFLEEDDMLHILKNYSVLSLNSHQIEEGTRHRVLITYVENSQESLPWSFYVQLMDKVSEIKDLSSKLQLYAQQPLQKIEPYQGAIFLVQNEDRMWYRGYIESYCNDSAKVYLIDVGVTTIVPPAKTKYCPQKLIVPWKAQAIKCRLLHADMLEQVASQFRNMTGTGHFQINVIECLDDGALLVQLLDMSHEPPLDLGHQLKLTTHVRTPSTNMSLIPPSSYLARAPHSIGQWSKCSSSDRQQLASFPTRQPSSERSQPLTSSPQRLIPVNVVPKSAFAVEGSTQTSLDPMPQNASHFHSNSAEANSGQRMGFPQEPGIPSTLHTLRQPTNVQHRFPLSNMAPTHPYRALHSTEQHQNNIRSLGERQMLSSFTTHQPKFVDDDITRASLDPIPQDATRSKHSGFNHPEITEEPQMGFSQEHPTFHTLRQPINVEHRFPQPNVASTVPHRAQHNTEQEHWTRSSGDDRQANFPTRPAKKEEFHGSAVTGNEQRSVQEVHSSVMTTDNESQKLSTRMDNLALNHKQDVAWQNPPKGQERHIEKPAIVCAPELPSVQHRLPVSQLSSNMAQVDQYRDLQQSREQDQRGEGRQTLATLPKSERPQNSEDITSHQQTFLKDSSSSKRTEDQVFRADGTAQKPLRNKLPSVNLEETNPEYFRQKMVKMDAPGLPEARSDPSLRGPKSTRLPRCMESIIFDAKSAHESKKAPKRRENATSRMSEQHRESRPPNRCSTNTDDKRAHFAHKNNGYVLESKPQGTAHIQPKVSKEYSHSVKQNHAAVPRPRHHITQMAASPGTMLPVKLMAIPQCTPSLFWAMPLNKTEKWSQLQLDIQRHAKSAKLLHSKDIHPGDVCLVLWSHNLENKWHRAEVKSLDADQAKVSFLDIGGSEYVEIYGGIKQMATELALDSALTMRCSLRGVTLPLGTNSWTPKIITDFSLALETCKEPVLEVVAINASTNCYSVVLRDKNHVVSINEQFGASNRDLQANMNLKEPSLPVGKTFVGSIIFFNTLGDFYVNEQDRRSEFMQQRLRLGQLDLVPMKTIQKGVKVLIRHPKDNFINRALVLDPDVNGKVKLYLLDKGGDPMIFEANCLKALPEEFLEAAPFAVPVKLAHVIPKHGSDWCKDQNIEKVLNMGPLSTYMCRIEGPAQEGRFPVSLVSTEDVNIAEELIEQGLVLPMNKQGNEEYCRVFVAMINPETMQLWVHLEFQTADLDEMQEHLQFEAMHSEMLLPPFEPDTWVLARSQADNIWYRAQVKEVEQLGGIIVSYIDYRNTEIVDRVFKLPPAFQQVPSFAVECQLAVSIKNMKGAASLAESLLITNNELVTLRIYDQTERDVKICDIFTSSGSICDLLVRNDFAEHRLFKAYVSCYLSPTEFYIQRVENESRIHEMDATAAENYKPLTTPRVGQMCFAKFSDDQLWYRAQVKNVMDCGTIARVQFCDYGNTAPATEFKEMPRNLQNIPALATKCHLKKLKPSFENIEQLLREQFFDGTKSYLILFHEQIEDSYSVTIFKDGVNLLKLLYSSVKPIDVTICHFISPELLWLRQERQSEQFARVCTLVNQLDRKLNQVFPGMICAARSYEDNAWYRARVDQQDLTSVQFIDTGKTGQAYQFKELTEELESIPPLAQKCCLNVPHGRKLLEEKLETLMTSKTVFQAEFTDDSNKKLKFVTLYKDGHNILEGVTMHIIKLTHFVTAKQFYVRFPEDSAQFKIVSNILSNSTTDCIPTPEIEKGMECSAWVDATWYRATVDSISDGLATVYLYDLGKTVRTSTIKRLPKEVSAIPDLTKECYLINPLSDDYKKKDLEEILTKAETLQAEIISEGYNRGLAVYSSGTDVIELLKNKVESPLEILTINSESGVGNSVASISSALALQVPQNSVGPDIPLIQIDDDKKYELEQLPVHTVNIEPANNLHLIDKEVTAKEAPTVTLTERLDDDSWTTFTRAEISAKQLVSKEEDDMELSSDKSYSAVAEQVSPAVQTKITASRIPVSISPYLQKLRDPSAFASITAQVPNLNKEERPIKELQKSYLMPKSNKVPSSGPKSSIATKPKICKFPDTKVSKNK